MSRTGYATDNPADVANLPSGQRDVVATYNDGTNTIYLPERWTGSTPTDVSVVVHEMVHHFQNAAGLHFACPQEREAQAYAAQQKWLGIFGLTLESEFEIDPFTLMVSTHCI